MVLLFVTVAAACSGNDSTPVKTVTSTEPIVASTETVVDDSFVVGILDDGTVSADELTAAYESYTACLEDGGADGAYAFDLDLRTGLVAVWLLPDDRGGRKSRALDSVCSGRYLGDLTARFDAANPPPDDLAQRQRTSMIACVADVDPKVAAAIPDDLTVNTADGASLIDVQLDPTAIGASDADWPAIEQCLAGFGAPWIEIGDGPQPIAVAAPSDDPSAPTLGVESSVADSGAGPSDTSATSEAT